MMGAPDASSGGGGGVLDSTSSGCVNTMTDPKNCGACGHDCLGASCSDGVCAYDVLATLNIGGVNARDPLYNDGTNVYFGSTGSVCNVGGSCSFLMKCAGAGCGMNPYVLAPRGPGSGYPFAVAGGNAYWFDGGIGLVKCSLSTGCPNPPPTVWAHTPAPPSIAADTANAYWPDFQAHAIMRCPVTGCDAMSPPVTIATVASTEQLTTAIVSDATTVFFATGTTIYGVPADGSAAATPRVQGLTGVSALAFDSGSVYWATTTGQIGSCLKAGCATPHALKQLNYAAHSILVDNGRIYWAQITNPGEIGRCTLPDCTEPLTLVRGKQFAGLTADDFFLYFSDGNLKKVAK